MKNQCKKCGRMLLIAEIPIKDKHLMFLNANLCSRCLRGSADRRKRLDLLYDKIETQFLQLIDMRTSEKGRKMEVEYE